MILQVCIIIIFLGALSIIGTIAGVSLYCLVSDLISILNKKYYCTSYMPVIEEFIVLFFSSSIFIYMISLIVNDIKNIK
jgi:hypothetical protein